MPGFQEILVILVVGFIVLVLFGKRMPDVARSLGQSLSAFKKGLKEGGSESKEELPPGDEKKLE